MNGNQEAYWPTKTQLGYYRIIRSILTPGKLDSYAGVIPVQFPDGIEKSGKIWLAYSVEGVGTKILVAQLAKKFGNIGVDLVAMNINDIICSGAKPFAFADYLALGKNFPKKFLAELSSGIRKAVDKIGVQVVSGETAVVPDMLQGVEPHLAFDLAGSSLGIITDEPIDGTEIIDGDVVVGLHSDGLHSNGFTLARPALLQFFEQPGIPCAGLKIGDVISRTGKKVEEELLTPTRIYSKEVVDAVSTLDVHGLAHITGQGFKKLLRLCYSSNHGCLIDSLPDPPPIFDEIQEVTKTKDEEMYSTFNMGIGFVIVVPRKDVDELISICKNNGTEATAIGKIASDFNNTIRIVKKGGVFEFQGKVEELQQSHNTVL